jgi:hypothetical protein
MELPTIDIHTLLIIGHIIGLSLGVGGATVSDVLFFKATKDARIDASEFNLMNAISKVIWAGLLLAIATGIGFLIEYLLVPEKNVLLNNPKIWAKLTIVSVIFVNGLVFHYKVFPTLRALSGQSINSVQFARYLPLLLTTGATSIISWYSALVLGAWRGLSFSLSYYAIVGIYLFILFVGITFANLIGRRYVRGMGKTENNPPL